MKSTKGAIACHHSMAWHIGGEGIAPKGLTNSLGTTASDATRKFTIGDGGATRNIEQGEVDSALEVGDGGGRKDALTNAIHLP